MVLGSIITVKIMLKKFATSTVLIVATFVLAVIIVQKSNQTPVVLASDNDCQSTQRIINTPNNITLSAPTMLYVQAATNTTKVDIYMDNKFVGKGVKQATGTIWSTWFDTRFAEPGTTSRKLEARLGGSDNSSCTTASLDVTVVNATAVPSNTFRTIPQEWVGLVNSNINFMVEIFGASDFSTIKPYIQVQWETVGTGSITSISNVASRYNSGAVAGNGIVKGKVQYAGREWYSVAPVSVFTATSTAPPATETGTQNTTAPPPPSTSFEGATTVDQVITVLTPDPAKPPEVSEPAQAIATVLRSDEQLKLCMAQALTEQGLQTLLKENRRPTPYEFKAYQTCFAAKKNIIPSIFAPNNPTQVKDLPKSEKLKLLELKNDTVAKNETNEQQEVLVFAGKANPGTTVLLYVFSEPLVLTTSVDSDGNWSYTLEDPLAPGEHEVYAVVDRGDGEYERTDSTSFLVETASASDTNPNGYSLRLSSEPTIEANNRSITVYVIATVALVGLLVGSLFLVLTLRKKTIPAPETPLDTEPEPQNQPTSDEQKPL